MANKIVRKLFVIFFIIVFVSPVFSESDSMLVIIVTPVKADTGQSGNFENAVVSHIQERFKSNNMTEYQLMVIHADSVLETDTGSDSMEYMLQTITEQFKAALSISAEFEEDMFVPRVYIPHLNLYCDQSQAISDPLAGKYCFPKFIKLPLTRFSNPEILGDFVQAFLYYQTDNCLQAIKELQKNESYINLFFQGLLFAAQKSDMKVLSSEASNTDSATFYFKKSLTVSISPSDSIMVFNNLGVTFQRNGKIDSARFYLQLANSNLKKISDPHRRVTILNNLGNIYLLSGTWSLALDIFNSGIKEMEAANDSSSLARTYQNMGNIYQLIYQQNKAIGCYEQALEIYENLNDSNGLISVFRSLGNVYADKRDFKSSQSSYHQGLGLSMGNKDDYNSADFWDRLGQIHAKFGQADSAYFYYQKSAELFDLTGDKTSLIKTLLHRAMFYQKSDRLEEAVGIYERSLKIASKLESTSLMARILGRLGDIYNRQENLLPAYDYYEQSSDLYEEQKNYENLALTLYNMGLIRLKQNDYQEGYFFISKALKMDEKYSFNNLKSERGFVRKIGNLLNQ